MRYRRTIACLVLLGSICAVAFAARLFTGTAIGFSFEPEIRAQILALRLTSAVTAVIIGVNLSASGLYLQTLLRNPLASPFILGLAAGAGVGVVVSQLVWRSLLGGAPPWWVLDVGALVGSLTTLVTVYGLSRSRSALDPVALLLVGVMISALCGSLILLLQFMSPDGYSIELLRWMMGSIHQSDVWHWPAWLPLAAAGVIGLVGLTVGLFNARGLDAATLSDDEARSVGVPLHRLRIVLFLLSGLMAAVAVTLAGPIGFVGLVAPHIARLIVGPRHASLLIASVLLGAILLLSADVLVQLLRSRHGLMPIGIVTSGIGAPLFIWLLRRDRLRANP